MLNKKISIPLQFDAKTSAKLMHMLGEWEHYREVIDNLHRLMIQWGIEHGYKTTD